MAVRRVWAPTLYWREDPAGGEQQREPAGAALLGRHVRRLHEAALAAHEAVDVHDRRAVGRGVVARPLHAADLVELGEATPRRRSGW